MDTYESVLLVKSEVFVYKLPPRTTNRGYRAADWNLNEPQWTGRMRLVSKGNDCILKLEDKNTGELFAKCPIDAYPGIAIEAVSDSSRYFVIRIQDDSGRAAFIGLGFSDRSDSFDMNVALQDHFKWLKKSEEIEKEKEDPKQELDLRFKEGETIKINMKITKKDGSEVSSRPKPRGAGGNSTGILPPPPGGVKIGPPPGAPANASRVTPVSSPSHQPRPVAGNDLLCDIPISSSHGSTPPEANWGEFAAAGATQQSPSQSTANSNWVQF